MHKLGRKIYSTTRRRLMSWYAQLRFYSSMVGPDCVISGDCILGHNTRIDSGTILHSVTIGTYSYLGPRCVAVKADIGCFCSIASEVHIGLGTHPLEPFASTHPAFYLSRPSLGWNFSDRDYHDEFLHTKVG